MLSGIGEYFYCIIVNDCVKLVYFDLEIKLPLMFS